MAWLTVEVRIRHQMIRTEDLRPNQGFIGGDYKPCKLPVCERQCAVSVEVVVAATEAEQ